jgi:pyrroline-5-carboxylate reductase
MNPSSLKNIAFVGGGNMAYALIQGLLDAGVVAHALSALDISEEACQRLRGLGVRASTSMTDVLEGAEVVVLAVKPQQMSALCQSIAALTQKALVISIAAGVRIEDLSRWLQGHARIIRTMPNTPALVRSGVTGLFAPTGVDVRDREQAENLMSAVGRVVWVSEERDLDAVTALSGSGPAYVFHFLEGLYAAGASLGLSPELTQTLALETLRGAERLIAASPESPTTLRQRVTSPGGTTEAALKVLAEGEWNAILVKALNAARDRAEVLSDQWAAH